MASHLIPEDSPFDTAPIIASYQVAVATALRLNEGTGKNPSAIAVCLSSFAPEWAITVSGSLETEYTLVYTTTSASMWPYAKPKDVQVTTLERTIESGIAQAIERVWTTLLRNVRPPDDLHIGLDGETYHFFWHAPFQASLAGKAWSPSRESLPGSLVALVHALRNYAIADPLHDAQYFSAIRESIESLTSKATGHS